MIGGFFAPTLALWRRDLMRTTRKRRTAVFLGVYAGLLAAFIISIWPGRNVTPFMVQQYAEQSLAMFTIISYIWIVVVMTPYGAASLTQERERETMEMLSLTLVPSWGVVLGKMGAHTGMFLLVLVAAMPVMSASAFFTVGTEIQVFLALVGYIATTAVACVAIGVAFSSLVKNSKAAVIFAYVGAAMMLGLPVLLFAATMELLLQWDYLFGVDAEEVIMYLARYFSPIGATVFLFNERFELGEYLRAQSYILACTLLAVLFACWRVGRINKRGLVARQVEKAAAKRSKKRPKRPMRPLSDRGNAWYALEARFGTLTRGRMPRWVFAGGCLVFGFIAIVFTAMFYRGEFSHSAGAQELTAAWIGVALMALAVVMPGIAANAFTREFDGMRMDLLRGTLLRSRDYIFGSVAGSIRSVIPLIGAIVLMTALLTPIIGRHPESRALMLVGIGSGIASIALATTAGIAVGALFRRTTTALMIAYATAFMLFVGAWLGSQIMGEIVANFAIRAGTHTYQNAPRLETLRELCAVSSPIVSYFENLDFYRRGGYLSGYWIQSVFVSLTYSVGFTVLAIWAFRFRTMRDG